MHGVRAMGARGCRRLRWTGWEGPEGAAGRAEVGAEERGRVVGSEVPEGCGPSGPGSDWVL